MSATLAAPWMSAPTNVRHLLIPPVTLKHARASDPCASPWTVSSLALGSCESKRISKSRVQISPLFLAHCASSQIAFAKSGIKVACSSVRFASANGTALGGGVVENIATQAYRLYSPETSFERPVVSAL